MLLVDLSRVAQDGTRVRASAGAASFRRGGTLEERMQLAREHLDAVTREANDQAMSARRAAARKRGAEQRLAQLEAAIAQIPEVTETKQRSGAKDSSARVSTTDPDARVMKMGDGGFRPAYNVQFATTTDEARVIVGVDVINRGSDANQSTPMLEQIVQRTGVQPDEMLVDGGYAQHAAIDEATEKQVVVYAPVPKPRNGDTRDPHAPRDGDSDAVAAWRQRMGMDEAKEIYKQRAARCRDRQRRRQAAPRTRPPARPRPGQGARQRVALRADLRASCASSRSVADGVALELARRPTAGRWKATAPRRRRMDA